MIKANVILDYSKWKNKIKDPNNYLKKKLKKLLGHLNEISVVDFDHTDVVRHPLVSKIVKAYSDQKTE